MSSVIASIAASSRGRLRQHSLRDDAASATRSADGARKRGKDASGAQSRHARRGLRRRARRRGRTADHDGQSRLCGAEDDSAFD